MIYCGQFFFQVDILRAILLKGNHLREEEMCVDEQVVGESGLGGSTEEEHEPDRGHCDLDNLDCGIKASLEGRV